MYANTEMAADRKQRGRRSAGIGENAERLPNSRAATRPPARFGIWRGEETVQPVKYSGGLGYAVGKSTISRLWRKV
jgi:hypothetical protein